MRPHLFRGLSLKVCSRKDPWGYLTFISPSWSYSIDLTFLSMSHKIISTQAILSNSTILLLSFPRFQEPASKGLRKCIPPIWRKVFVALSSFVYSQGETVAVTLKWSWNFLHFLQFLGLKKNSGYLLVGVDKSNTLVFLCQWKLPNSEPSPIMSQVITTHYHHRWR